MTAAENKQPGIEKLITEPSAPLQLRKRLLLDLCATENERADEVVASILAAAATGKANEKYLEMSNRLAALIEEMKAGPLRSGTFLRMQASQNGARRAEVLLCDGDIASSVIPEEVLAAELRRGDTVWLEAQGRAVLFRDTDAEHTGEEARLERQIGADRIEVSVRDQSRFVFHASANLLEQLENGEASPGCSVLVCPQRRMGFIAVPKADEFSRFEYLERKSIPDVIVERDIGYPPAYIDELTDHIRMEMQDPELGRQYRVRRSKMTLLEGTSGTGKTHSIHGFIRRLYEVMSEVTGTPLEELPPRVMRLRCSTILSKWLGDSDKHIDRFFDEVVELAGRVFRAPSGVEYQLPLLVIFEEVDGIARERGEDAIYDRIQTTLLQRFDPNSLELRDRLVLFVCTTNVPHVVDPAFLRRAGGTVEHFRRLNRSQFLAILDKHLRDLPFSPAAGEDPADARRRVMSDLSAWLFSPNGSDPGQVELTFVGTTTPVVQHRRDFLTGGLVDRAVQQAAAAARRAHHLGAENPGLNCEMLTAALDHQVRNIVEQLHERNAGNYVDIPDGVRVGSVRRIEQPSILPIELERAS